MLVVDARDERVEDVSIGEGRGFTAGAGFGWTGRAGGTVLGKGRRTTGGCFFTVAMAAAVEGEECSADSDGLRRLIGPGRFSTSQDDAERWTP